MTDKTVVFLACFWWLMMEKIGLVLWTGCSLLHVPAWHVLGLVLPRPLFSLSVLLFSFLLLPGNTNGGKPQSSCSSLMYSFALPFSYISPVWCLGILALKRVIIFLWIMCLVLRVNIFVRLNDVKSVLISIRENPYFCHLFLLSKPSCSLLLGRMQVLKSTWHISEGENINVLPCWAWTSE